MPSINTNVSALNAQAALAKNSRAMSSAMEQLSTGSRVNSAKDDAAGMAIGTSMTSQIRGLNQAVRNVNDGVNLLQTADGALTETTNMLQRMRELAVQSASGTYSTTQRSYLAVEFNALGSQIESIASQTTWNGYTILTGTDGASSNGSFSFQAGQTSGQTISVTVGAMTLSGLGITASTNSGVSTAASASATLAYIDSAISIVNSQRATIGATINRMTYAADNMTNISANTSASRSTIMDTDYATASTNLSKAQIIQQASTAMLAQANQQPQTVLALLK
ncbi:MAG: flagellin FliC [Betaproteobacteria bacterium]|nr:flagellin FliC [Betaproteobacteria bacterium]